jgi:hypothetical protein
MEKCLVEHSSPFFHCEIKSRQIPCPDVFGDSGAFDRSQDFSVEAISAIFATQVNDEGIVVMRNPSHH